MQVKEGQLQRQEQQQLQQQLQQQEQLRVLRLTTPELKSVRGPFRSG
jgi:hypothetical protein